MGIEADRQVNDNQLLNTKDTRERIFKTIKFALMDLLNPKVAKDEVKKHKFDRKKHLVARSEWPQFMQDAKELKGICVGVCVYNGKWSNKVPHSAHAHVGQAGKYAGYICFRTEKDYQKDTTCKHELAHIISNSGHTKKWAEAYVKLVDGKQKWLTVEWLQKKYKFKDKKKAPENDKAE